MIKIKKVTILATLFLFITNFSNAQNDSSDFETWSTIGLKYEVNKKWSLDLEQSLRLDDSSSEIQQYFTQLGATFEPIKNLEFGVGARYIRVNDNEGSWQGYENHLRIQLDAALSHKVSDFSFKHRLRFQSKKELDPFNNSTVYANRHLRLKSSIRYNIKNWKLDPKFSAEVFNQMGNDGYSSGFDKYRLTLGASYKIKKFGTFRVFYMMEKALNVDLPNSSNILGFKLTYNL